jgi:hypothetical protein
MLKQLVNIVAVTAVGASAVLAGGCKSGSTQSAQPQQPYALTGNQAPARDVQNDPRYLDSKGHFRPDWVADTNQ